MLVQHALTSSGKKNRGPSLSIIHVGQIIQSKKLKARNFNNFVVLGLYIFSCVCVLRFFSWTYQVSQLFALLYESSNSILFHLLIQQWRSSIIKSRLIIFLESYYVINYLVHKLFKQEQIERSRVSYNWTFSCLVHSFWNEWYIYIIT